LADLLVGARVDGESVFVKLLREWDSYETRLPVRENKHAKILYSMKLANYLTSKSTVRKLGAAPTSVTHRSDEVELVNFIQ
jgi:hypothetical protein